MKWLWSAIEIPLFLGNSTEKSFPHQTGLELCYGQDRVVLVQGGDAVECGQARAGFGSCRMTDVKSGKIHVFLDE